MSLVSTEKFYKLAQEKTEWISYQWAVQNLGMPTSKRYAEKSKQLEEFTSNYLIQQIYTGGYRGGNCWNDTQPWYESSDEKIEFSILKEFLLEVYPDLTLKHFSEIQEKFVKTFEKTESEYYGNTSDYTIFVINLNDLYTYLAQNQNQSS